MLWHDSSGSRLAPQTAPGPQDKLGNFTKTRVLQFSLLQHALVPSKNMIRGCHTALAVKYYYTVTCDVSELLGTYFLVAFPKEHARYREAFDAGVWHLEDPGPWLSRALVYKLQVKPHRDALDGGPTVMFNMGQYEGGRLYNPCLDLKFLSASPLLWSAPVTG